MRAMLLESAGQSLLEREVAIRQPVSSEVLLRVSACGVCRTDLHVIDGELASPKLPLILGHEIVGRVVAVGAQVKELKIGQRVGVPWLAKSCQQCTYCLNSRENLCDNPLFTGYQSDGGYAEYALADAQYCLPLPDVYGDAEAAPLLCAGLIGWRCLKFAGQGKHLGLYGFGAAAHIIIQVASYQGRYIYAFTRPGDKDGQAFAIKLGSAWSGGSDEMPPVALDAAIIFAPVGELVPQALKAVRKGGIVVCGGIHMSDIPSFPYEILWGERMVCSVANLTRADAREFLELAPRIPVKTQVQTYDLADANRALNDLRSGKVKGAAVLTVDHQGGNIPT